MLSDEPLAPFKFTISEPVFNVVFPLTVKATEVFKPNVMGDVTLPKVSEAIELGSVAAIVGWLALLKDATPIWTTSVARFKLG